MAAGGSCALASPGVSATSPGVCPPSTRPPGASGRCLGARRAGRAPRVSGSKRVGMVRLGRAPHTAGGTPSPQAVPCHHHPETVGACVRRTRVCHPPVGVHGLAPTTPRLPTPLQACPAPTAALGGSQTRQPGAPCGMSHSRGCAPEVPPGCTRGRRPEGGGAPPVAGCRESNAPRGAPRAVQTQRRSQPHVGAPQLGAPGWRTRVGRPRGVGRVGWAGGWGGPCRWAWDSPRSVAVQRGTPQVSSTIRRLGLGRATTRASQKHNGSTAWRRPRLGREPGRPLPPRRGGDAARHPRRVPRVTSVAAGGKRQACSARVGLGARPGAAGASTPSTLLGAPAPRATHQGACLCRPAVLAARVRVHGRSRGGPPTRAHSRGSTVMREGAFFGAHISLGTRRRRWRCRRVWCSQRARSKCQCIQCPNHTCGGSSAWRSSHAPW